VSRRSILLAVLALPPALFAVPVLRGIASTLHALLNTSQPYFADVAGPSTDGLDLHLGGPLYGDPDHEYPSGNYTPLLSLLVAGLDTAHEWTGWALLATILASLGMIGLAAVLAWRRTDGPLLVQAAVALGALGMGALAWWLVAFVPLNLLYTGRPDQLSWAFAFAGLVLVPAAARGSARALVASGLLLSLAFWTKQTAIAAPAAAVLWMAVEAVRGRAAPATALRFAGALLALNAVVFGVLQLASVSSMAGWVGLVGGAAYGATKASLEAMSRAWAAEFSASGVRVNAIAPGPVYTPSPSGPEFITALGETTPMHRASQPEEIAEVVAFLASPRASYITGTTRRRRRRTQSGLASGRHTAVSGRAQRKWGWLGALG
jgi:hypothetical protein